jgi:hypothetical protein
MSADADVECAALCAVQDSVTLSWAPPSDNGSAITFYKLEMDDGRGGDFQHVYGGQAELQSAVITGLQSGLHYRVRLRAENGVSFGRYPPGQQAVHATITWPYQALLAAGICMLCLGERMGGQLRAGVLCARVALHTQHIRPCCVVLPFVVACRRAAARGQPWRPSPQQPACPAVPWP